MTKENVNSAQQSWIYTILGIAAVWCILYVYDSWIQADIAVAISRIFSGTVSSSQIDKYVLFQVRAVMDFICGVIIVLNSISIFWIFNVFNRLNKHHYVSELNKLLIDNSLVKNLGVFTLIGTILLIYLNIKYYGDYVYLILFITCGNVLTASGCIVLLENKNLFRYFRASLHIALPFFLFAFTYFLITPVTSMILEKYLTYFNILR